MGLDVAIKVLYDGQLPTGKTTLFTVPANSSAVIKTMTFKNLTVFDKTIAIYLNLSGTSRQISPDTILAGDTLVADESYSMEAGDTIEGQTQTVATIDAYIGGVINTLPL
jgi:hypothetical protein